MRYVFATRTPVPVSHKSNDAILCQLVKDGKISIDNLGDYRKDVRKITYSKEHDDHSIILVTTTICFRGQINCLKAAVLYISIKRASKNRLLIS